MPAGDYHVRIPADVERPDRILAGLTARQLAILVGAGGVLWLAYLAVGDAVGTVVFLGAAAPVVVAAVVVALGRRDGVSLDRLVLAALRHARTPRRQVLAPDGVAPPPAWVDADPGRLPAPLRLPARAINDDGTIDLGPDGVAAVVTCSTVNFTLATDAEQEAMVAAFARSLNALAGPTQILVRAEPVDLAPAIDQLRTRAPALPHPALETAALEHADFLTDLAARRDLLHRRVLVVVREPTANRAHTTVRRRADDTARALSAAGVTAGVLDGQQAAAAIRAACDPWNPTTGASPR